MFCVNHWCIFWKKQTLGFIFGVLFSLIAHTQCISKYRWLYLQVYAKASASFMGLQPVQSHRNRFLECSHALFQVLLSLSSNSLWFLNKRLHIFYFALGSLYYIGPAQIQALHIVSLLLALVQTKITSCPEHLNSHLTGHRIVSSPYKRPQSCC